MMRRVRHGTGTIHVFTFKDGLFARAAHDLRLRFDHFEIELAGESLSVLIQLDSLRVDGPVRGGAVRPEDYDDRQRTEIERTARHHVLHIDRSPFAKLTGVATAEPGGLAVRGELALAGRTGAVAFTMQNDGALYRTSFEIRPSHWGIAPYTALLGTIRVQDRLRIEVAVTETIP